MARVLLIALVVVLAAGGWAVAARAWLAPRRAVGDPRRVLDDPAVHRNHQAMARWIDARVGDDMVRPMIPEPEQQKAKALLAEFYGDEA